MLKKILFIAAGSFIVPFIVLVFFMKKTPTLKTPSAFPTPTIHPEKIVIKEQKQTIDYAPDTANRLLEKMENAVLLQEAQEIKDDLESKALLHDGVISTSTLYIMRYIFAFDLVQVEILTTADTSGAKKAAVGWLQSQGLDDKSICDLPVMFYLSSEAKEQIVQTEPFDYLPEGCI